MAKGVSNKSFIRFSPSCCSFVHNLHASSQTPAGIACRGPPHAKATSASSQLQSSLLTFINFAFTSNNISSRLLDAAVFPLRLLPVLSTRFASDMPSVQMQKTRPAPPVTKTRLTQKQSQEIVQTLLLGGVSFHDHLAMKEGNTADFHYSSARSPGRGPLPLHHLTDTHTDQRHSEFFAEKVFTSQFYPNHDRIPSYKDVSNGKLPQKKSALPGTSMQVLQRHRSKRADLFLDWLVSHRFENYVLKIVC